MFAKLLSEIKTKNNLDRLKSDIGLLHDSLFKSGEAGFETTLYSNVAGFSSELVKRELETLKGTVMDKEKILDGLQLELAKFKILSITLAFEPTKKTIDIIYQFVRENIGEMVVVDYEVDRNILGGAKIVFEGKYWDFSLVKVFDEEFVKIKSDLLATHNLGNSI